VVLPDRRWLENDWFLCQEAARHRKIQILRRNEAVYQRKLRERQGQIPPATDATGPGLIGMLDNQVGLETLSTSVTSLRSHI
jgi:hypothetical protein